MPKAKIIITQTELRIDDILPNPNNPRVIKDHRFKLLVKSIQKFPEMLDYREIVVDEDRVILGGNMRWKACKEAGIKNLVVTMVAGLDEKKKEEFIIKDNANYGVWDWDSLANKWSDSALNEWGLNIWTPSIEDSFTELEDDEPSQVAAVDDFEDDKERKKVIPIEFNIEDYDEALELYNKLRKANIDIPALFTQKLGEQLCNL